MQNGWHPPSPLLPPPPLPPLGGQLVKWLDRISLGPGEMLLVQYVYKSMRACVDAGTLKSIEHNPQAVI